MEIYVRFELEIHCVPLFAFMTLFVILLVFFGDMPFRWKCDAHIQQLDHARSLC